MRLRRLNEDGIEALGRFLDSLSGDFPEEYPASILEHPETSEPVGLEVEVEGRNFEDRLRMATYLYDVLEAAELRTPEADRGLWAWLALFYFDQLCPRRARGRRRPGERARWIPVVGDFRRYYRHLVAGPYRVFKAHREQPERTLALLCGPPAEVSGLYRELASRQELVTNPSVVEAATLLYYERSKHRVRRGANPRRFAEVLMQLDVVWDLYSMSADELIAMLPAEFDRLRPSQITVSARPGRRPS